jgi:hypothetical protein
LEKGLEEDKAEKNTFPSKPLSAKKKTKEQLEPSSLKEVSAFVTTRAPPPFQASVVVDRVSR